MFNIFGNNFTDISEVEDYLENVLIEQPSIQKITKSTLGASFGEIVDGITDKEFSNLNSSRSDAKDKLTNFSNDRVTFVVDYFINPKNYDQVCCRYTHQTDDTLLKRYSFFDLSKKSNITFTENLETTEYDISACQIADKGVENIREMFGLNDYSKSKSEPDLPTGEASDRDDLSTVNKKRNRGD